MQEIFICINESNQHDIIQLRIAWVVLDNKKVGQTILTLNRCLSQLHLTLVYSFCLCPTKGDADLYKLRDLDIGYHQSILYILCINTNAMLIKLTLV